VSDLRLVGRMLAGDEAAFEDFFDAFFPPVYRFARTRLRGDDDAAEEVAQAALCRAVTKLHTYRGEASLLTWLCTFCRHEVAAYLTHRRRLGQSIELAEDAPEVRAALESLGALVAGPEERLRRDELVRRVWLALDALPARYGDALEWKYIEGLSVKDIAERLGIGPKAAESVLTRAREAFRDAFVTLDPRGGEAKA